MNRCDADLDPVPGPLLRRPGISSEAVNGFVDAADLVATENVRLPIEVGLIGSGPDGVPFKLEPVKINDPEIWVFPG